MKKGKTEIGRAAPNWRDRSGERPALELALVFFVILGGPWVRTLDSPTTNGRVVVMGRYAMQGVDLGYELESKPILPIRRTSHVKLMMLSVKGGDLKRQTWLVQTSGERELLGKGVGTVQQIK